MLATTLASARTVFSSTALTVSAESSVKIMIEVSGRQVASGAGAMKDLATSYSPSLAAPARRKPCTICSVLEPAAGGHDRAEQPVRLRPLAELLGGHPAA